MLKKTAPKRKRIPENLGNSVCGVWPYAFALAVNAAAHTVLFVLYGQTVVSFFRLFFSFLFFIYPFYYIADSLWSLRPSVCDMLSGRIQINRKYYMNTVQKEVRKEHLVPVTVSIPVYSEDNEVIFRTLRDSLAAVKRYGEYSGRYANIIVSDDGLAPMLGGVCGKEAVEDLIIEFSGNPFNLTLSETKAAERILFYRKNKISFVARPANDRAGLFKKSSNLNFTLRLGDALSEGVPEDILTGKGGEFEGGYFEGDIKTREIILLLDKDSGVKERIIEAIVPEFALDERLAYVQCATKAINSNDNYYTLATGQQTSKLFHNVWPCKALQGFFVPLVGHNVFLRKSALFKSGYWAEDRVSEDYDKAIVLYGMGYHGKYAQLKGLEFTEYASRTFIEETGKQRRYAYGLFEMLFDGTVRLGKTRNCDIFYMIMYFFSLINEILLLPTILVESYFGSVHFLWAGFIFCNVSFLLLPLIRGFVMKRCLPKEYIEHIAQTFILVLSFIGHSHSIMAGAFRYIGNKIKKNNRPFPATNVDKLEYKFTVGLRMLTEYLLNNKWYILIIILCLDRGMFMLTKRGIGAATTFAYCYVLFCAVFVPVILTPHLFGGVFGENGIFGRKERVRMAAIGGEGSFDEGINERAFGHADIPMSSPVIVKERRNETLSDIEIESFLGSYQKILLGSINEEVLNMERLSNYTFESCIRKDPDGKKDIYLLARADGSKVLLKITKDYPQEDAIEEAKLLSKLDHPGIPKVYDYFEHEGKNYIIREYIEGRSLYEVVNTAGNLSTKDIFDTVKKLADILRYLHMRTPPIIHRDIKPQNIIVGKDGRMHLIDFGIARFHKEQRSQDTSVLLTLDYASPEQYGFEQTTPLSDIYSFGMVILFMATGRTTRTGLESQIVNNRLRVLIEQCIAFNPQSRFQSAGQIIDYINDEKSQGVPKSKRLIKVAVIALISTAILSAVAYGAGYFLNKSKAEKSGYDRGYEVGYSISYSTVPVLKRKEPIRDNGKGNTSGNSAIDKGAFAVSHEDISFYISDGDILSMSGNGGAGGVSVLGRNAEALSFINGWLYYSSPEGIYQTSIYTKESDFLFDSASGELLIDDGKFYLKTPDTLYRANPESGELLPIIEDFNPVSLNISKETAVYIEKDNGTLFKYDLSGNTFSKIIDRGCRSVCLFDGNIYCAVSDGEGGELIKVSEDLKDTCMLAEINTAMINVDSDGIFFLDDVDKTLNIISFDGRIRKQISKNRASDFNISENWIFYHNEDDGNRVWCVRTDGANDHPVYAGG